MLKKLNWATGQALMPVGLERVFPEEHPCSGFTAGRKDVKLATHGALKQHYSTGNALSAENDVEGLPFAGKIPCRCRWIPVKDQLLPWARKIAIVNCPVGRLQLDFPVNCL